MTELLSGQSKGSWFLNCILSFDVIPKTEKFTNPLSNNK